MLIVKFLRAGLDVAVLSPNVATVLEVKWSDEKKFQTKKFYV